MFPLFAALAIAGVVILATEKLDVMVILIEVEIEVAAALRAFQQAGEYAGCLRDRGLFAARPFLEQQYPNVQVEEPASYAAFLRRIHEKYEMLPDDADAPF